MQFRQKCYSFAPPVSLKTTFDFGDEELTYTVDNAKQKQGASVAYRNIPTMMSYSKAKSWQTMYVYVFFVVFCALIWAYSRITGETRLVAVLPVPAIACLIYTSCVFFQKRAGISTIYMAQPNPSILIIEDKNCRTILEEIHKRRKEQLRKKFAEVDFDKPYYEEAQKFRNLREQEIITEQEYQYARQKIAAMKEKSAPVLPGEIRLN
jgi:hypothetical protein